jgi:hypothetical protein
MTLREGRRAKKSSNNHASRESGKPPTRRQAFPGTRRIENAES